MASPAQVTANQLNAGRSTGPKTPAGKQASSRNATRHGLTGSQVVITGEDPEAFEAHRQGLHASYKPANGREHFLVDQIAANAWRLLRAQRVEAALFSKLAEDSDDPIAAIAEAFLEKPAAIAKIQRYVTTAQNAWYKAMNELAKLQKQRAHEEYEAALTESWIASRAASQPVGFVSQNSSPADHPAPLRQHAAAHVTAMPAPAPQFSDQLRS